MHPHTYNLMKAAYSVTETTSLLSLGRTSIYELVKSGELKATKCGRRTLFLATDVAAFLAKLQAGGER
ncbi:helix-turn-helix domain-containing protein [Azospirillum soli]|uniref:helix-turn-helix domain-containing protein n=1 Tax=Azospirillum soli TaxID=1304799 RepID=UPI001AE9EE8D|nr:helix-turn-helix domain-containing protein [Azospirillum soli]MBP2312939.1 excisionase family DNA binding protein [Azospirillum soli]